MTGKVSTTTPYQNIRRNYEFRIRGKDGGIFSDCDGDVSALYTTSRQIHRHRNLSTSVVFTEIAPFATLDISYFYANLVVVILIW
jgi:hypothetical protein